MKSDDFVYSGLSYMSTIFYHCSHCSLLGGCVMYNALLFNKQQLFHHVQWYDCLILTCNITHIITGASHYEKIPTMRPR